MGNEVNENGLTYKQWLAQVDIHVSGVCGLTHNDLADSMAISWDAWRDGADPKDAASDLLYDNDFPSDLLEELF